MTVITQDMAPVTAEQPQVNDKIFTKISNDLIFTPILNTPALDQSVVISTLISNASEQMRTILSKIVISESFTTNLKAVNTAKVEDLNNTIKYVYRVEESGQVPYYIRDLKKQGLSLALLRRISKIPLEK